jgi:hypothetical protein
LCICKISFVAQIKVLRGTYICAKIEFYKLQMLNHCFFCRQKSKKTSICAYVEPSAAASAAALATVGAPLAAVGAAIATVAAAATAVVSAAAMIAISATAITAALWFIVVCPSRCLCFPLPPPLPAPAFATVVCRHHCHCCHRCNRCPVPSAATAATALALLPLCLNCRYLCFPCCRVPLPLFPLPPCHLFCFQYHCHRSFRQGSYH